MRDRRPRGAYRDAAAGPAVEVSEIGHAFVVTIARPCEDDEPFDLSSIPTFTPEDIARMEELEETEKRGEMEQILAQQSIVLETMGRRKTVTAAAVAFGLGVAATLLVRRAKDDWS